MIVSSAMIAAYVDFVRQAQAGRWDAPAFELSDKDWEYMGEILKNRRRIDCSDFLDEIEFVAEQAWQLEIRVGGKKKS